MAEPKVLVGCPTFEGMGYCLEKYLDAVKELDYKNFELVLVENSKTDEYYDLLKSKGINVLKLKNRSEDKMQNVTDSRNVLRDIALKENFEYFLSLHQDVILPKDLIKKLLAHEKEIISGLYFGIFVHENVAGIKPMLFNWVSREEYQEVLNNPDKYPDTVKKINANKASPNDLRRHLTQKEIAERKLMEVKYAGLGCLLIKRNILEKISFTNSKILGTSHIAFCEDVRKNGYKIYADTALVCDHVKKADKINNFL